MPLNAPFVSTKQVPDCLICGVPGPFLYKDMEDRLSGVPGAYHLRHCESCGLLWQDPRAVDEDILKYYEGDYFTHETTQIRFAERGRFLDAARNALRRSVLCGQLGYRHLPSGHGICFLGPILGNLPWIAPRAKYHLRELMVPFVPGGLLVDVGCGTGEYLGLMRQLGWDVLGVEPDPASVAHARENELRVFNGSLKDARLEDASADVVTMNHVIEHLADPPAALAECFRILKPAGRLVIYTPNSESLATTVFGRASFHLDPPRHVFLFSPRSMAGLFHASPFRKASVGTSAFRAKKAYDCSRLIERTGKTPMRAVSPQAGRRLFALAESLAAAATGRFGEELEVVAFKEPEPPRAQARRGGARVEGVDRHS